MDKSLLKEVKEYIEKDQSHKVDRPEVTDRASQYKAYCQMFLIDIENYKSKIKELEAKVKRLKKKRTIGTNEKVTRVTNQPHHPEQ